MPSKYVKFNEGDVFAVPLRNGGYAIGVLARKTRYGTLGYFFGPRYNQIPSLENLTLTSEGAIFIAVFSEYGIKRGLWPVLGSFKAWNRTSWPVPLFKKTDLLSGESLAVEYEEGNLLTPIAYRQLTQRDLSKLPRDGTFGDGLVEIELTCLLDD